MENLKFYLLSTKIHVRLYERINTTMKMFIFISKKNSINKYPLSNTYHKNFNSSINVTRIHVLSMFIWYASNVEVQKNAVQSIKKIQDSMLIVTIYLSSAEKPPRLLHITVYLVHDHFSQIWTG